MYYKILLDSLANKILDLRNTTLFNKLGMQNRLEAIEYAASKDSAKNSFRVFVIEMIALIDILLTLDNPAFQNSRCLPSAKLNSLNAIIKILNQGKFVHPNGIIFDVSVDKYIKIEAFKKNKYMSLLTSLEVVRASLESIFNFLSAPHDPSDLAITLDPDGAIQQLQMEKERVFQTCDQALDLLKKFDKDIAKLYKRTSTQVFNQMMVNILSPTSNYKNSKAVQDILNETLPRKKAIFLAGDYPDQIAMTKQMKVVYISALNYIRNAALTLNPNETTQVLPAVFAEKYRIMQSFNHHLHKLFKALKPLSGEVSHKHYKKADLSVQHIDEAQPSLTPNTDSELQEIKSLLVISRDITPDELISSAELEMILKNDNDYLLIEADIANKIIEIYKLTQTASEIFATTPHHLHILPTVVLKADLENYGKHLEEKATQIKTQYESFMQSLSDDIYKFAESPDLVAIDRRLHQQILPDLQTLRQEIETAAPEIFQALQIKLNNVDADVYDISDMLQTYRTFHQSNLQKMKMLTDTHKKLTEFTLNTKADLASINLELLKLQRDFKDRKRQPLEEIEAHIQAAQACLARVEKGLSQLVTPFYYEALDRLWITFKEFNSEITKFDQYMTQARNKMITQNHLINNAKITQHVTRFGEHPNRINFNTTPTTTAQPTIELELDEKRMTL